MVDSKSTIKVRRSFPPDLETWGIHPEGEREKAGKFEEGKKEFKVGKKEKQS